jgi:excinuclease UvrABC nuclease subunit
VLEIAPGVQGVGPFATRRDAEEWLHMLEDAFDLCRYHQILEQAPHGQACAYFDMGKCPAPCNGSISLEVYRQMVAEALAFSAGQRQTRLTVLQESMQAAAKALAFEKAASIRQTFERAAAFAHKPPYRHVCDIASCCWLIVQRGGPPR